MEPTVLDLHTRLTKVEERQNADYKALHGNGHAGIIDAINEINTRLTVIESSAKSVWRTVGWAAAIVAWVAQTVMTVANYLNKQ